MPYPSHYNYIIGGTRTAGEAADIVNPKASPKAIFIEKIAKPNNPITIASIVGANITNKRTTNPLKYK